jgi:hypothetical protein
VGRRKQRVASLAITLAPGSGKGRVREDRARRAGRSLCLACWPYAFYDPFFVNGPDLLLTSIFWPGPLSSPYYAYNPSYYGENSLFDVYGNAPYANSYAS